MRQHVTDGEESDDCVLCSTRVMHLPTHVSCVANLKDQRQALSHHSVQSSQCAISIALKVPAGDEGFDLPPTMRAMTNLFI